MFHRILINYHLDQRYDEQPYQNCLIPGTSFNPDNRRMQSFGIIDEDGNLVRNLKKNRESLGKVLD